MNERKQRIIIIILIVISFTSLLIAYHGMQQNKIDTVRAQARYDFEHHCVDMERYLESANTDIGIIEWNYANEIDIMLVLEQYDNPDATLSSHVNASSNILMPLVMGPVTSTGGLSAVLSSKYVPDVYAVDEKKKHGVVVKKR